jgi:predicted AAA+ superfamily ATPase
MIKKSDSIIKLLQAIAYQIGNQVSYNELSQIVGLDPKTIQKYIHILEQAFIIFRLPSFARNLRNELKTTQKIYFWDTGIRNSIIRRFAPIDMRDDVGALWENFIIAELLKSDNNNERFSLSYFWRTNTQLEIDLVQDHNGVLSAYEIKRNPKKTKALPKLFMETYMPKVSHTITRDNWLKVGESGRKW